MISTHQFFVQGSWTKILILSGALLSAAPMIRSSHAITRGSHISMSQETSSCSQASLRPTLHFLRCDGLGFVCNKGCVVPDQDLCILSPLCEICEHCLDLKTLSVRVNYTSECAEYQTFEARKIELVFSLLKLFFSWRFGRHNVYNVGLWWNQSRLIKLHLWKCSKVTFWKGKTFNLI